MRKFGKSHWMQGQILGILGKARISVNKRTLPGPAHFLPKLVEFLLEGRQIGANSFLAVHIRSGFRLPRIVGLQGFCCKSDKKTGP